MTTAKTTTTPQINDLIDLMRKNTRAALVALAAPFLVLFFDVFCQMTT